MESPPSQNLDSSPTGLFLFMLPLIMAIVVIVTYLDRICIEPIQQPPTEIALETHQNSHPPPQSQEDIETGHVMLPQPQQDITIGYMTWINETTVLEFKDIEEGSNRICCPICLEEFEDGHEIIMIMIIGTGYIVYYTIIGLLIVATVLSCCCTHDSPPPPRQVIETGHIPAINETAVETIIKLENVEEGDGGCCSICLEEFKIGHELMCIKKCRHVFHRFCIHSWFDTNRNCPICRCSVD
ncbi:Zinc finger RING-type [Arabidopsis suecica]|uniref:RING-type E3 ubiquitin transferase n=1 Tax=Arabidopsis suecica TaxID=45249 RepID=A0A8T1YRK7_ARASU|nr:Zinc finger RING-type [Arabidopsis suecica]